MSDDQKKKKLTAKEHSEKTQLSFIRLLLAKIQRVVKQ